MLRRPGCIRLGLFLLDRYQIFLGSIHGTGGMGSGESCSRHVEEE
jgi:hypothetical protein